MENIPGGYSTEEQQTSDGPAASGGGSFACGRRWLGRYSPLRGCADLAAWATAKIPRRSTPRSFQTGSEIVPVIALWRRSKEMPNAVTRTLRPRQVSGRVIIVPRIARQPLPGAVFYRTNWSKLQGPWLLPQRFVRWHGSHPLVCESGSANSRPVVGIEVNKRTPVPVPISFSSRMTGSISSISSIPSSAARARHSGVSSPLDHYL